MSVMTAVETDALNRVVHASVVAEHAYRTLIKALERGRESPVIPLRVLFHEHRSLQKELGREITRLGGDPDGGPLGAPRAPLPDGSAGIGGFWAVAVEELAALTSTERALRSLRVRDMAVLRAAEEALRTAEGETASVLRTKVVAAVRRNLRLLDVLIEAELEHAA